MSVTYVPIDGEKVSHQWAVLLFKLRREGVVFQVREGKRTMARQAYLRYLYERGEGSLAAKPSRTAPHIRVGRFDHAIDFGNAQRVKTVAGRHGITLIRTVPGEEWHLEVEDPQELADFAKRYMYPVIRPYYMKPFRPNNKVAVTKLQRLLRGLNLTDVINGKYGKWTRRAVRRFQRKHDLKVDGVVGPSTWIAIRDATNKGD